MVSSVQLVAFAFFQQSLAAYAQYVRGFRLLAASIVKNLGDVGALQLFQCLARSPISLLQMRRQICKLDSRRRAMDQSAFQNIAQFADIAGKIVLLQRIRGLRCQRFRRSPMDFRKLFEKMFSQRPNDSPALAQRWNHKRNNTQAVIKVLAETLTLDCLLQ